MIGNGREQLRIACIGGGPAGLYFAILAKRQDPASVVTVYERSPEDVTYGWGVVFWDDLLSDLRATDPETARLLAEGAFQWFDQVLDVDGRTPTRLDASGYSIGRRQLLEILNGRAREVGVDLRFVSEVSEPAALPDVDLVVAADGVNSQLRTMRRGTFGTRESLGRNRYVWLGTTRRFDNFTFGFTETHAGWIWFHAYGFDTDRSTLIVECSPETWARLRFDTLDAEASLRRLEQIFARQLGGHRLITQTSE